MYIKYVCMCIYINIYIYILIYVIMKTMCLPSYHHSDFVATHAFGDKMHGYTLLVPMNQNVLSKLCKEHRVPQSGYK